MKKDVFDLWFFESQELNWSKIIETKVILFERPDYEFLEKGSWYL